MKIHWFPFLLFAVLVTACGAPAPASDPAAQDAASAPTQAATSVPTSVGIAPASDPATQAATSVPTSVASDQNYTGEGNYRISGEQNGMQVVNGYAFQITFRASADGTITGEGSFQKVEASMGSEAFQCTDPGMSSLTFPPIEVTGTVIKDPAGQAEDTFQLNIMGPASTSTSEFICVHPIAGTWSLGAVPDQGFFLSDIQIDAADGARANGTNSKVIMGTTQVIMWLLEIHKQTNP